jgi:hypothetical protein
MIKQFITELKFRNEPLFYFGMICLALAIIFILFTTTTSVKIAGVNAWFKPFKFALSIALYSLTMAWYAYYLPSFNIKLFNWTVIILLGFEVIYISIQAARGQLSHFNLSTPFYSMLYGLMALAATAVTLYTAYIAILFFRNEFPNLPVYYLWSIRIALILFVIFSLEGFVMGSRLSHTIGGEDGGRGLPIVNWSKEFGVPRIAHFIGMHALQVLPMLSFYLLKNTKSTIAAGIVYGILALVTLLQALNGKPYSKI